MSFNEVQLVDDLCNFMLTVAEHLVDVQNPALHLQIRPFEVRIEPLEVPQKVHVKVGGQWVEVPISELDPSEVEELANDFVAALLAQVAEGPAE
jgi:hypothetical protein